MPIAFLQRAYHTGTRALPERKRAETRVVNLLALMGTGLTGLYTLLYGLVFHSAVAVGLNVMCLLGYLGYFAFLRIGAARLSKLWLVGVFLFQMAVFSLWVFSRDAGLHLFVVAGIPLVFLVLGHRERHWRTGAIWALLAVFFAAELLDTPKLLANLPADLHRVTYLTVVPVVALLIATVFHAFVRELRQRGQALHHLTLTDPLTGVVNRRGLLDKTIAMRAHAERLGLPLCVLMIDIDHFKNVNDVHGHPTGDRMLVAVARLLRDHLRKVDAVGRMGGEEFAVLLANADQAEGMLVAEALRRRLEGLRIQNDKNQSVGCTVSMGVSRWEPTEQDSFNAALARADTALYHAKTQGRNQVVGHPRPPLKNPNAATRPPHPRSRT
jgi:diguanylate cyclase (GGDEF)-like protein